MSLLAPWALWLSIVGVGVAALYLLKVKRPRERVPSLDFWLALVQQTRSRSLFKRLKRLLSLLLWLVIVGALVLAVGDPLVSAGRIKPRSIAVVLDNSASMQAVEDDEGRTRLDLARDALARLTAGRPVPDEWLLIDARREPRVVQAWTRDRAALRKAAAGVAPFAGEGRAAPAVALARQLLDGKRRPTIVVISDGADGGLAPALRPPQRPPPAGGPATPGAAVSEASTATPPATHGRDDADDDALALHWPVGEATDNLGVTHISVRLHRQSSTHHVFVRVENAGPEPVEADLVFLLDGLTHAVQPLSLTPAGAWEDAVPIEAPDGGVLEVRIDRPDALPADDRAFAVLEPIAPASVLLVSAPEAAYFFEQALRAMTPLVSLEDSRSIAPEQYAAVAEADVAPDLTIFNGWIPDALPTRGAFVCIGAPPREVEAQVLGELTAPRVSLTDEHHPLARYIVLRAASIASAPRLALAEGPAVIAAAATGEPVVFLADQPGRRILCLAFDVLASDLPIRNAFPILLRNAVTHLSLEPAPWIKPQHAIGEGVRPLRPPPASAARLDVVRIEDGAASPEPAGMTAPGFVFTPRNRPHVLRIDVGDESAFTAVNLASPRETRLGPAPPATPAADQLPLSASLFGAPPWIILAIGATLLIAFEWFSFHMRWTE